MSPSSGEYYINVDQSREQHQWRQGRTTGIYHRPKIYSQYFAI